MSESPVAPALANTLRNATEIRFTDLPLTRDRIWQALHHRRHGAGKQREDHHTAPTRSRIRLPCTDVAVGLATSFRSNRGRRAANSPYLTSTFMFE